MHLNFWEYFDSRLTLQEHLHELKLILKELQKSMPNLTMKGLKSKVHNLKFCYRRHVAKSLDKEPLWWLDFISKDWRKHAKLFKNKGNNGKHTEEHEILSSDNDACDYELVSFNFRTI